MRLAHPWLLALAPFAVAALAWLLRWADQRRERLTLAFTGDPARFWSAPGFSASRRRAAFVLTLAIVGLMLTALARPLWFVESGQHEMQGINYLLLIDASRSMLATDVKPNRYGAVTNALDPWLARARLDRIGIITFAGAPYLNAPLTFDTSALRMILGYLEPEDLLEGGSSIATALERAGKYFATNAVPQRLVILLSDGEELEGNAVETARQLRQTQKLMVCAVGVGTAAGARIPADRQRREAVARRNRFGQEVITRLGEGNLRRIASAGGGRYYPLGPAGEGLEQLRQEVLGHVAEAAIRSNLQNYRELYQIPLALALACLCLKLWLRAETCQIRPARPARNIVR
jgi:Ca-activated chloride channel family protein